MSNGDYFRIDQCGIDGQWRVFWIRPDGYGTERNFGSRMTAERYVAFMESFNRDQRPGPQTAMGNN
jgi:hypothetical protein